MINTGYRRGIRELSLPAEPARALGFWPNPPRPFQSTEVEGYGGARQIVWSGARVVRVRALVPQREGPCVVAGALICEGDDEILISDALTGGLGIVILDAEHGIWRFRDDPPDIERQSEPGETWPAPGA